MAFYNILNYPCAKKSDFDATISDHNAINYMFPQDFSFFNVKSVWSKFDKLGISTKEVYIKITNLLDLGRKNWILSGLVLVQAQ